MLATAKKMFPTNEYSFQETATTAVLMNDGALKVYFYHRQMDPVGLVQRSAEGLAVYNTWMRTRTSSPSV